MRNDHLIELLVAFIPVETFTIVGALVILPIILLALYALMTSLNVHFEISLHPLRVSLRTEGRHRKRPTIW